MAKHILRFRQADRDIFKDIRSGRKTVETRAATVRFKNIKLGDTIVFVCGQDRFEKTVKNVGIFKNIEALLSKYQIKDIAPQLSTADDLTKMYDSFPGYQEKIENFGLIALEFE